MRTDSASAGPAAPVSRDPTERFSDRVDDYVRYRPGYPPALIDYLRAQGLLQPSAIVADIGAGTGISSALFLDAGCEVYAVEPNAAMRESAEHRWSREPRFHSVDGRAEATGLGDASVDLVVAATAFHWFDPMRARTEFKRILRGDKPVALFWNVRRAGTAFMRDYEEVLVGYCRDYAQVGANRRSDLSTVQDFFEGRTVDSAAFPHAQTFDFAGLLGRVLSSSYAPKPDQPGFEPMHTALHRVFDAHAIDGKVTLNYDTRVHVGRMG